MDDVKLKQDFENVPIAGEYLTKLAVNNKIVEMRKNIRQSRVHCINKMSREIRNLRNRKGSEEKIAKNSKKIDKLIEQMAVIKKVNPDVVSKFALQNEKSLAEITNNVNETVENKALARLACHKSVHQKVLEFREKFPGWKKLLILLLESLGEKYKNKKPKKPVVSKKKEKKSNSTAKNKNSVDKEKLKVPNTTRAACVKSSSGLWAVAKYESVDGGCCKGESEDTNDKADFILDEITGSTKVWNSESKLRLKNSSSPDRNVKTEPAIEKISEENVTNTESSLAHKISNVSNAKPELKKLRVPNRNVEIDPSAEMNSEKIMKTESNSILFKSGKNFKKPENVSTSNVPEVVADPFFITKDNKEYLSISAKHINDTEESPVDYKESKISNPQLKSIRFHTKPNQFKSKSYQNNDGFSNSKFGKRKHFDSVREKPGNAKDASAATSLHPSWEAKKKLTTTIQNSQFQGKKIKFDD